MKLLGYTAYDISQWHDIPTSEGKKKTQNGKNDQNDQKSLIVIWTVVLSVGLSLIISIVLSALSTIFLVLPSNFELWFPLPSVIW